MKSVLVISAHCDDIELGCGASISKFLESGYVVHSIAFSTCNNKSLKSEHIESLNVLGIKSRWVLDYPVRRFSEHRQEILEALLNCKLLWNPTIVFIPRGSDIHQDHEVIHKEALRAFKDCSILGYELIWNNVISSTECVIEVSSYNVGKKISALSKYKSQGGKRYFDPDFISNLAKVRGTQNDCEFAECFQILKWYL